MCEKDGFVYTKFTIAGLFLYQGNRTVLLLTGKASPVVQLRRRCRGGAAVNPQRIVFPLSTPPSATLTPPPGLLRSPRTGEAFYKKRCVITPGSAAQPPTGEDLACLRLPCAKGAPAQRVRDCFITTPPSQLRCATTPGSAAQPPHRGGFL